MDWDWVFGNTITGMVVMFLAIFVGASFTLILCGLHEVVNYWRYRREKRGLVSASKEDD